MLHEGELLRGHVSTYFSLTAFGGMDKVIIVVVITTVVTPPPPP